MRVPLSMGHDMVCSPAWHASIASALEPAVQSRNQLVQDAETSCCSREMSLEIPDTGMLGPLWRPVSTVKIDQVLIMQMMASFVHCMTQVTLHFDTEYELRLCADTDSKMAAPVYPL